MKGPFLKGPFFPRQAVWEADWQRYLKASHAMQSAVAYKMNFERSETEPKHLRVGVNAAMVEHSALVCMLIRKGLIQENEYLQAIANGMEDEVALYEQELGMVPGSFK